jgi:acetyl/propionyl-CoA carboxylase alpha subunit
VRKLLVANRGEIARRVFSTAKAMGISTVAVFSDPDAYAPHVTAADESVRLPGATSTETYLCIERIIDAATAAGADAIHPGYGFLSENAGFARACARAGITFVGPSPEAIDAMASKIAAKQLMAAAGVPTLPSVTVAPGEDPGVAASDLAFPVLVKAAFGGGGRGMRIARAPEELPSAIVTAQQEAAAAFGDGTVFLERYVPNPRHIEVQIMADRHGNVFSLFERECSIQRRYQKIIEECPSPAVDASLRAQLCQAAESAARAINYVGAGTVEFVVDPAGDFFFLEVNTRLQVEHPVTEMVTGLDLVELQLRVARGEILSLAPEMHGHAIEARLYAEDVAAGFAPVNGVLTRFELPALPGVRIDAGYDTGSTVSIYYDAMLAKVIAHGESREVARARLGDALRRARVHGLPSNRELLIGILEHDEFRRGRTDTGFLERHAPAELAGEHRDPVPYAIAAALAAQAARRGAARVQPTIPSGWRNVRSGLTTTSYQHADRTIEIGYSLTRSGVEVQVDGRPLPEVDVWSATATAVDLSVGGIRQQFEVHASGTLIHVDGAGDAVALHELDRLPLAALDVPPGSSLAPLPGSVVSVAVQPGDQVTAGQLLVVLEAMKMQHTVVSSEPGVVSTVLVEVGAQVESGQTLVVVDAADVGAASAPPDGSVAGRRAGQFS